jgi:hypothetical protein
VRGDDDTGGHRRIIQDSSGVIQEEAATDGVAFRLEHMSRRLVITLIACVALGGCKGGRATPTEPGAPSYAGEWSGTTFQRQPISFTVSSAQKVTRISVGYAFSGCSGVETFPNLDLAILPSPSMFAHGATLPDGRGISIQAFFLTDSLASAGVIFYGSPSCGSTGSSGPPSYVTRR